MNLERCWYTQSNEHNSQMSMVLKLESSCVNLTVIFNDIVLVVATYWVSWLILWYYLVYIDFYFESADDIYLVPVFCTDPYFYVFFLFICGVQQTCRHLRRNSNSSQSSLFRISGWANASSLDWIFLFMSWCLEVPAWTSFYVFSSFLETLRFSSLK